MSRNFIAIILTVLLSSITMKAAAMEPKIERHTDIFSLHRSIFVVSPKISADKANEIRKILDEEGISSRVVRNGLFRKAKIVLHEVEMIDGVSGRDGYKISVSKNRVDIQYTNQEEWVKALEYFRKITTNTYIEGHNVSSWSGSDIATTKGEFLDAHTRLLSKSDIEHYIRNTRNKYAYIQLVGADNWRLETSAFGLINPKSEIYPKNGHYTLSDIRSLLKQHNSGRVKVIPVIDLLTPNKPFERVTGHKLNSVEGMRFVRAILEEYVKELQCKEICVGAMPRKVDKRYLDFLYDLSKKLNIELIIKD